MIDEKCMVSICCVTYNHEKYLAQTIEGFLIQKTSFDIEILIHDDASTDDTPNIIKKYASQDKRIVQILRTTNLKSTGKPIFPILYKMSKGKYIALCEGDDYWTDEYKLQKQVDFLEHNQKYILCFHRISILENTGELVKDYITHVPENYESIETIAAKGNYIHTPSVVFRNIIETLPSEFLDSPLGDYFLYMVLAQHGKVKLLEDVMAVYRKGVGIWSSESITMRNYKTILTRALLYRYFNRQNNKRISDIFIGRITYLINTYFFELNQTQLNEILNEIEDRTISISLPLKSSIRNANNPSDIDLKNISSKRLFEILINRIKAKLKLA